MRSTPTASRLTKLAEKWRADAEGIRAKMKPRGRQDAWKSMFFVAKTLEDCARELDAVRGPDMPARFDAAMERALEQDGSIK